MTVKELIYRLKDFPRDAVVTVRSGNKRQCADAVDVKFACDPRRIAPIGEVETLKCGGATLRVDPGIVVRIVGEKG